MQTTARVWSAAVGVSLGILASNHGVPEKAPVLCVGLGFACVVCRRVPYAGPIGVALVAMGLAASRSAAFPVEGSEWGGAGAAAYRDALAASLEDIPQRAGALLAGLTIGDTSSVDYATVESFRRSGLAHLMAVSGSNVAMVLAAVAVTTVRLPLLVRGACGATVLGAYVAVVGPEPSVLRAAGMGATGLIAYVCGRNATSLNALGIAVTAVLALKPDLLFAIGLHLSVAATLGIVVWTRPIEAHLSFLPSLLRAPIAITLGAQVAVAPLLILAFERLSLVAPLANVMAAPAVPPATLIGLLSGLAGLVSPDLGGLLARVAAPFAQWILWVSDETASWSWASVDLPAVWGRALIVPVGIGMAAEIVRHRR